MGIDQQWMQEALALAQKAAVQDEVPVGALLVYNNEKIAEGWNQPIALHDPTAHAEILVLRQAGEHLENYRLLNTTLYVTLEPCPMCAGAILNARIKRLVFGAFDARNGAAGSAFDLFHPKQKVHPTIDVFGGVLAQPCSMLMTEFFRKKRKKL
jgi:tRNA(adenine34) deaminase